MTPGERYPALDVVRGVAVMGILLANIVGFGLPEAAYFSPLAWGGSEGWDRAVWFANFVAVEGRFRGLFSFLFGASMLLVIERAEAEGRSGAAAHLARMAALFVFGVAHLYLLWWGDILQHYAIVGAVALLFARARTPALLAWVLILTAAVAFYAAAGLFALEAAAPRDTAGQIAIWNAFSAAFGVPPPADLAAEIAAMRGPVADGTAWRWRVALDPLTAAQLYGAETLSAMLLGMAAYRAGFVTGSWPRRRYAAIAAVAVPLSLAGYAALGWHTMARGFDVRAVYLGSIVASTPLRIVGYLGYAALTIALLRPGGKMIGRVAAAGRMAFSNYLGTTILMDLVFTGGGLGLFARLSRAELYLLVPPVWALMLWWSPLWLARYRHGPLEWAWRSMARARWQPMRR